MSELIENIEKVNSQVEERRIRLEKAVIGFYPENLRWDLAMDYIKAQEERTRLLSKFVGEFMELQILSAERRSKLL